ncbi:unnamed protein product [Rotaria sordida]|uniref:Uncharacterized protein n=1 Tax=Rotaria sordida TaxID=392033 RepID=A0A815VIN1_9BILA|nr:unnamed protein product [Rotaria sordida]CAF4163096.1 unnamed protein product [Rotaria sordida]
MYYGLGIGAGVVPNSSYLLDVGASVPSRFQGDLKVYGEINPTTNTVIGNSLTVNNNTTLSGLLTVNSNATVNGSLNVNTNATVSGSLAVNSNAIVDGSLTVNNGKGVAYNTSSATNLKIFPFTTATFFAILPGFGLSAEGSIGFNGGFTGTPRVFVGDIDATGGSTGELYRVQLQLYGCSTTSGATSCKARLLNTSPNPVNYSITWNCVAIGY